MHMCICNFVYDITSVGLYAYSTLLHLWFILSCTVCYVHSFVYIFYIHLVEVLNCCHLLSVLVCTVNSCVLAFVPCFYFYICCCGKAVYTCVHCSHTVSTFWIDIWTFIDFGSLIFYVHHHYSGKAVHGSVNCSHTVSILLVFLLLLMRWSFV